MKSLRLLLSCLATSLALYLHPAAARLDLSAEEREILEWSRGATAVVQIVEWVERRMFAEEYMRRSFLLARCSRENLLRDPDRWLNAGHAAVLAEATRTLDRIISDDVKGNGGLENDWQAALVYSYRSWDRARQVAWLGYMRSAEAARGLAWATTIRTLEGFGELAVDLSTGATIPLWVNWLGEVLAGTGLSATFERAASTVEAGLGDTLATQLSWPAGEPLADERRRARQALADRLAARWGDIIEALEKVADPETVRMGRAWSSNPAAQDIHANLERIVDATYGMAAVPTTLTGFLEEAGRGKPGMQRTAEALLAALRMTADRDCAALR